MGSAFCTRVCCLLARRNDHRLSLAQPETDRSMTTCGTNDSAVQLSRMEAAARVSNVGEKCTACDGWGFVNPGTSAHSFASRERTTESQECERCNGQGLVLAGRRSMARRKTRGSSNPFPPELAELQAQSP
eukprot:TRINITY_DN115249_c0_g1_i1.p2 TRINITY_DN115249_c0_g1~~TRINITY_DN115249_c0_g1_i1.p2  ORF type:complete len:141 (-),score=15.45 TRINITY_DN115249_c0_g1_i1:71-463(-)